MAEQAITITKFRGIKQKAATEIPDNYASDALNVRLDREMDSVATRPGHTKLNETQLSGATPVLGLWPYYNGTTKRLMAAVGQTLAYWDGEAFQNISTELAEGGDYYADTLGGMQIIVNGVEAPWKYDGTTLAALGGSPPQAKYALVYKGFLLLLHVYEDAAWHRSRMRVSDVQDPETWPTGGGNTFDINKDDGDQITGAAVFLGQVRVFKERTQHAIFGDDSNVFSVNPVTCQEGAVSQRSIVVGENAIYWVGRKGIYKDDGVNGAVRISDDIKDTVAAFNQSYMHLVSGVEYEETIRWAVPTGDSAVPDKILIYYPRLDTWVIDSGQAVQIMSVIQAAGNIPKLYAGGNAAGFVYEMDSGTDDAGAAINSYWQGKEFDLGLPYRGKWWKRFKCAFKSAATDYSVNLQYGINGRTLCTASGKSLLHAHNSIVTPEWYLPLAGDAMGGIGETLKFKVGTNDKAKPWTMYSMTLFAEAVNY